MGDSLGATSMLDRKYTKSDTFRLWRKDELLRSADFEEQVDHTEKFQEILEQMRKYALMDVTSMNETDEKGVQSWEQDEREGKELNKLLELLDDWRGTSSKDDAVHSRERGLCEAYYQRLAPLQKGMLEVKNDGRNVDASNVKKFVKGAKDITMKDMSSSPVFAHEPSVNDIRQGGLADCFLM